MTIVAFAACTKEAVPGGLNQTDKEKISVNVSALMGELTPDVGETKSSVESVVRLTWKDGDTVSAYCGSQYLGHLNVSTDEDNKLTAKLSGELTAPSGEGTVITLVHSNLTPVISGGAISVNLDCQKKDSVVNPFVVYGTLESDNQTIENKVVPFKFATSLINVTVAGLADACVDSVLISGINTVCKLTLKGSGEPEIAGAEIGTIAIDSLAQPSSSKDRAIFSVGIVKDETTPPSRKITAYQGTKRFGSAFFTNTVIAESTSYITVCNLKEADGSRGTIGSGDNAHSYVCIAGTKWATNNLALTNSGNKPWKGGNESAVKVPGTDYDVIVGDYFQWAASYKGYNVTENQEPDSLLIYTSFTNTCIGDSDNKFTFLGSKKFGKTNAPYGGTNYTKYISADGVKTLDYSDDAARVVWGSSWRMPTSAEFNAMREATYWAWDDTDKGYYVYAPQSGDAGKKNSESGVTGTYNKSDALLFFLAAGNGTNTSIGNPGNNGFYCSSSLYTDDTDKAYYLSFNSDYVGPQASTQRYFGYSVRPVSD